MTIPTPSPPVSSILDFVVRAYGSLDNPNWKFAIRRYEQTRIYSHILDALRSKFRLEDTTDLNYDVAVFAYIEDEKQRGFGVALSLVGPFAVGFGDEGEVLDTEEFRRYPPAAAVVDILQAASISILDRSTVETLVEFNGAQVELYSVLFYFG